MSVENSFGDYTWTCTSAEGSASVRIKAALRASSLLGSAHRVGKLTNPKMRFSLLPTILSLISLARGQYTSYNPTFATVHLRIEGPTTTIYSAYVTTHAHNVTTATSGTHICDGTNHGANPSPGPTLTGALDSSGTAWDGTWYASFEDFFITSVGGVASTNTEFWGLLRNWAFTDVGGCQQRVVSGDEILIAWDAFTLGREFLKLEVDKHAVRKGESFGVRVSDGVSGRSVDGAAVGGAVTGADGKAQVSFGERGIKRLKAEKTGNTRSNEAVVYVY